MERASHSSSSCTPRWVSGGAGVLRTTNWRAEQAIRPAVVIRKLCDGNRTRKAADTRQVLSTMVPRASAASACRRWSPRCRAAASVLFAAPAAARAAG